MYKIDFKKPIHIHFIGIGGISMSGLAEILLEEGFTYPALIQKNHRSRRNLKLKAHISLTGRRLRISRPALTVSYTAAINKANPELMEAVAQKIPMLTRAELLGSL